MSACTGERAPGRDARLQEPRELLDNARADGHVDRVASAVQIRFVREAPWSDEWKKGAPTIWPGFAGRSLIQGDFAEDLARAIKGQRVSRRRLQKKGVIEAALKERHNEFIKNALERK